MKKISIVFLLLTLIMTTLVGCGSSNTAENYKTDSELMDRLVMEKPQFIGMYNASKSDVKKSADELIKYAENLGIKTKEGKAYQKSEITLLKKQREYVLDNWGDKDVGGIEVDNIYKDLKKYYDDVSEKSNAFSLACDGAGESSTGTGMGVLMVIVGVIIGTAFFVGFNSEVIRIGSLGNIFHNIIADWLLCVFIGLAIVEIAGNVIAFFFSAVLGIFLWVCKIALVVGVIGIIVFGVKKYVIKK